MENQNILRSIISSNVLGQCPKVRPKHLANLRVLGIDEVGISDKVGPIIVGFYIHEGTKLNIRDTKALNRPRVEKYGSRLTGKKHIEIIHQEEIISFSKIPLLLSKAIYRGINTFSQDDYDLIVIDGKKELVSQEKILKPVLFMPKADEKVYSVTAASIIAKVEYYKHQDRVISYYKDNFNLDLVSLNDETLNQLYKLYGPTKYHRTVFTLAGAFKGRLIQIKNDLAMLEGMSSDLGRKAYLNRCISYLDNAKKFGIISKYKEPRYSVNDGGKHIVLELQPIKYGKWFKTKLLIKKGL